MSTAEGRVLFGIGHPQVTVDVLNSEWCESGGNISIDELPVRRNRGKFIVEHFDGAGEKVGRVNVNTPLLQ
jgi:hypothetical protein